MASTLLGAPFDTINWALPEIVGRLVRPKKNSTHLSPWENLFTHGKKSFFSGAQNETDKIGHKYQQKREPENLYNRKQRAKQPKWIRFHWCVLSK